MFIYFSLLFFLINLFIYIYSTQWNIFHLPKGEECHLSLSDKYHPIINLTLSFALPHSVMVRGLLKTWYNSTLSVEIYILFNFHMIITYLFCLFVWLNFFSLYTYFLFKFIYMNVIHINMFVHILNAYFNTYCEILPFIQCCSHWTRTHFRLLLLHLPKLRLHCLPHILLNLIPCTLLRSARHSLLFDLMM